MPHEGVAAREVSCGTVIAWIVLTVVELLRPWRNEGSCPRRGEVPVAQEPCIPVDVGSPGGPGLRGTEATAGAASTPVATASVRSAHGHWTQLEGRRTTSRRLRS